MPRFLTVNARPIQSFAIVSRRLLTAFDRPDSLRDHAIVGTRNGGVATSVDSPLAAEDLTGCVFPDELESAEELSDSSEDHGRSEDDQTVFIRLPPEPPAAIERPLPSVAGYEILGELGRGGMGVVYRARQVRLNRPCVLKMILGGAHAGTEAVARFLAEAEAVAQLAAPEYRADPPHRRGRRSAVLRAGVRPRRQPGPASLNGTPWPARRRPS